MRFTNTCQRNVDENTIEQRGDPSRRMTARKANLITKARFAGSESFAPSGSGDLDKSDDQSGGRASLSLAIYELACRYIER